MKKVLLLNAGYTEIPLIEELKKLGCYVVTSGLRGEYPGHKLADRYIAADYSDRDALLKICREEKMDGIVSNAFDLGLVATSYVAEQMGWKGHDTHENTMRIHQKDLMMDMCEELDIPSPRGRYFSDEHAAFSYLDEIEYPVIVKAVDQSSGIGISRADGKDEAVAAVRTAFEKSKEKRVLIEEYIVGHQEVVTAFVVHGKVVSLATANCYSPINPYLIQTETMMSTNYDVLRDELKAIIERMFSRLNLVDGLMTIQYIARDGRPYVIDMMRRCLGNRYLWALEAVNGFPWYEALVRAELGMDLSGIKPGAPRGRYAGHHAIMSTRNGVYRGMEIPEEIMRHVFTFYELFDKGQTIRNHLSERLGYIYYTYDTREELDDAAAHFNDRIRLDIV